MRHFAFFLSALLVLVLGMTPVAPAQATPTSPPVLLARGGVSLDQAVEQVRRQTGGRILDARTVGSGNRAQHRIKVLLPSGKVRIITVPAGGNGRS